MSHDPIDTTKAAEAPVPEHRISRREALRIGAVATAAVAASPAAAAQAASRASDIRVTANPVTLTFMNRWTGPVGGKAATTLFQKFTKETGIQITNDVQPNSGATYQPAVRTAFASSSPPDLAADIAGPEVFNLARAGAIRDITAFYNTAIKPRDTGSATTGAVLDGKVWGISSDITAGNLLWFNPDYLKKYGLDGNSVHTWSQWVAQLKAIKKGGGTPIVLGAKDLWPGGHYLTDLVQRTLGDEKTAILYNRTVVPGMPGTPKWTDPAVVSAFQKLVDLIPYFQNGFQGEATATADALFLGGRAAYHEMGAWFQSGILATPPSFKPDFIFFPTVEGYPGTQRQITIASTIIMASSKSPHWAEIQKWYLFMSRPDNARFWAEAQAVTVAYKLDRTPNVDPLVKPLFNKLINGFSTAGPSGTVLFNDEAVDVNMYTKYIWQGSTALFSGALTAQALCAQLEAATEAFQKSHPK